jgi:hypothetical protein
MKKETRKINGGDNVDNRVKFPCDLCGKWGEVVLHIVAPASALSIVHRLSPESPPFYRLEVCCPDRCDEGTLGENIIFSTDNIWKLKRWLRENEVSLEKLRRIEG